MPSLSGAEFRKLFEAAPGLYLVLTPALTIVGASDAYLAATMTRRTEIVGRGLFEVFPDNPADPSATGMKNLRASLDRVLRNRVADTMAVQKYDVRRPESEGGSFEERYWSPVNSPVFDEDGRIIYIIHRVEDVTEFVHLTRKESEQHRRADELEYRAATMESEVFLRAQELQSANERLREANAELDRIKAGLEIRVEEALADLSRANEVLRESERKYRILFENNPHPLWVIDTETLRFLAVNEAAVGQLGFTRGEFLSMTLGDIRPDGVEGRPGLDAAGDDAGTPAGRIWKHRRKDGALIDVEITSHEIEYEGRRARVVLALDVTERKKIEAQMLRAQRMESIGTLAGGIAHDLNNVLAPILMAIEILRRRLPDEQDARMLDTLEQSARRGAGMVKQVLAFARGVEGERSILQVKHIVEEVEKIVTETFNRSIQILSSVPRNLWTIHGDATQLYQVLMNLCVNARDAMPLGGTLRIEALNTAIDEQYARMNIEATPGPYVVLTVTDSGTGIPPAIIDKIFEPFYTTKEPGKGTGLGLSTVVGIVKGHGGFVNVYSEPGKGSQFKVYLPAAETSEHPVERVQEEAPPPGDGRLILVVDDELGIRDITRSTLEFCGYRVLTASDGTEALALYARHGQEIRAVVTDMMMPYMDGPTTIRALRNLNPDVRIVAMSGLMENRKIVELLESKQVRFIQKPFTSGAFLRLLAEVVAG